MVDIDIIPNVHPASRRDVVRYARHYKNSVFPAIVLSINNAGRVTIEDGAHRLAAARSLGHAKIAAYVGFSR